MTIKYKLKEPNKTHSLIVAVVRHGKDKTNLSMRESIATRDWNERTEKVKGAERRSIQINSILDNFKAKASTLFANLRESQTYSWKTFLNQLKGKQTVIKNKGLIYWLDNFINYREKSTNYAHGSIRVYRDAKLNISLYLNHLELNDISMAEINDIWLNQFITYLFSKKPLKQSRGNEEQKGLSNAYVKKIVNSIKQVIKYADNKGEEVDKSSLNVTVKNFEPEVISLTDDELEKIYNYKPTSSHLHKIRSLFILQCYTGLRVSDLLKLDKNNFDLKNEKIKVYQEKTDDMVTLPILSQVKNIWVANAQKIPSISEQKYNEGLKKLAKEIGIDSPTILSKMVANKITNETKPKYELVSSHTARKTFVTMLLRKGMPQELVMKLSGHKDLKSFRRYIDASQEEAERQMMELLKRV